MTRYFQVECRERGSDNFLVLDVAQDGEFRVVWDRPGLRFLDRSSAAKARDAARHYGLKGSDIDAWRVESVEVP